MAPLNVLKIMMISGNSFQLVEKITQNPELLFYIPNTTSATTLT
jgi:hypothetical protein